MADLTERDLEAYLQPEFKLKQTRFRIEKLLPMEGYRVLERVRVAIGDRLNVARGGGSNLEKIGAIVAGIPEDTFESVRIALFEHITFTKPTGSKTGGRGTPLVRPVHPDEGIAFEGLEPADVYEVFVRAFIVNFFHSFAAILSRFPDDTQDSSSQDT